MTKLIQALRRNPDAIALAVLSVVLGAGRQALATHPISAFSNAPLGIHWVCVKPAAEALDCLRTRLRHLGCDLAAQTDFLPEFHR